MAKAVLMHLCGIDGIIRFSCVWKEQFTVTRDEALRVLGLKGDVSPDDIKVAYKEMAQILHPDKYAENAKLRERATEQFKQVNQARDVLLGKSARAGRNQTSSRYSAQPAYSDFSYDDENVSAAMLKARLVGIAAARVQLVAQLDAERDSRKVGLIMVAGGAIAALLARRIPAIMALATTALIWGLIKTFGSHASIRALTAHLNELEHQRIACEKALKKL